jgi:hypothetical protein
VTINAGSEPQCVRGGAYRKSGKNGPTAREILKTIDRYRSHRETTGSSDPGEVTVVVAPDQANRVAEEYSKSEVMEYLYENCFWQDGPLLGSPDDAHVIVAGGPQYWTAVIHSHTFSGNDAVTKPIASID